LVDQFFGPVSCHSRRAEQRIAPEDPVDLDLPIISNEAPSVRRQRPGATEVAALANSAHSGIQDGARSILAVAEPDASNWCSRRCQTCEGVVREIGDEFTVYLLDTVYSVIIEHIQISTNRTQSQ
jgi:hypothetical protein